jgi:thiosulfate/3-mercaptopyruvate sulfurtransferase
VEDREERRARFLVTPEGLAAELGEVSGPVGIVVLEVGQDESPFLEEGHIPGARFLPWSAVAVRRDGLPNQIPPMEELARHLRERGVTRESRIVLYDRGAGLTAGRAWAVLDYAGLGDRTRVLDGQWAGWMATVGEVAREADAPPEPGNVVLRPDPSRVVAGERVADLVWARTSQVPGAPEPLRLLDARPPAEFTGETPGDEVARPGHIPGANNLFWRSTTGPDEAPFFLETAALQALFDEAGAPRGSRVLTYCRTGGQAGHLYFVSRLLGYDAAFYDGSFVEWSGVEEWPVSR